MLDSQILLRRAAFRRACLVAGLTLVASMARAAEPNSLQNEVLKVTANAKGGFSITALPSNRQVVAGHIDGATDAPKHELIKDGIFGAGESLVWPAGRVVVFPKLPFALIRGTLKNDGGELKTINRIPLASLDVKLGQPASKLKTQGTGGLLSPDKNPGSYAWLAVAEPETRNAVVAGWLTHDRASGIVFSDVQDDKVTVKARSDYGNLHLAPGKSAETETLAVGYFEDGRLGLEAYADAVAKQYHIKLPPAPVGFCTWYAEKHGGAADEKNLAKLVDFVAKNLRPFGFEFVQIDDKWQEGDSQKKGPNKNFTAFKPNGPYPSGMKATADDIKEHALRPGIWFMPFAGTYNDPWFKDHQDWFVKTPDGKPFDVDWGGTSLDMTYGPARDYLKNIVHRIAKDWGYTYFKMDGLYTGMAVDPVYPNAGYKEDHFGNSVLANPEKTNVEAFRDGLKLVRETAGPNIFFLGCTASQNMRTYGGSFGLVDGMRVGPDNKGNWADWAKRSPVFGSRHYFLNGRVWWNDPDPTYVRKFTDPKKSVDSDEDARTIACWAAIAGQLNSNSDWIPDLPPERLELLKRTMQAHGKTARPVDYFEHDPPRIWVVTDEATQDHPRRDIVALFNWGEEEAEISVPIAKLGLPGAKEYAVFDYWSDKLLPPATDKISAKLPKHGCQILAVRPMENHPFVISSSRSVTQGMLDIVEEKWDAADQKLSGKSNVIGDDTYVLSVVNPGNSLKRITIKTPNSGVVSW